MTRIFLMFVISVCLFSSFCHTTFAHGIAGDRYFPPTVTVDDPYAADEVHAVFGRTGVSVWATHIA
jgi:hypothetical protein